MFGRFTHSDIQHSRTVGLSLKADKTPYSVSIDDTRARVILRDIMDASFP